MENPYLHEARLQSAPDFLVPYGDQTFDLVYCNSVLEHVSNPSSFFAEVARVLKPGGRFLAKTPNKHHYIPMIAGCTPQWFHNFYNRLRGRSTEDTFHTVYRCNTEKDIVRVARQSGLSVQNIELVEGRPEYLRLSAATYLVGMAIERLVNATSLLRRFRCVMYVDLAKPAS
jgi:2-polyprenyl-3-methyl-5-hydroxy-6-metoxy-1,4-benzoquinol methylase